MNFFTYHKYPFLLIFGLLRYPGRILIKGNENYLEKSHDLAALFCDFTLSKTQDSIAFLER